MSNSPPDITQLLLQLGSGESEAKAPLLIALYPELRRMARRYLRNERPEHTLQATALVNEAYLQFSEQLERKDWKSRSHFLAVAAQLMRRILVDHARTRKAFKRNGDRQRVELTDVAVVCNDRLEDVLLVDAALSRLAEWGPRQSKVVELRFFGGLTEEEIAEVLGITSRTVKRDWNVARAWLQGELASPNVQ